MLADRTGALSTCLILYPSTGFAIMIGFSLSSFCMFLDNAAPSHVVDLIFLQNGKYTSRRHRLLSSVRYYPALCPTFEVAIPLSWWLLQNFGISFRCASILGNLCRYLHVSVFWSAPKTHVSNLTVAICFFFFFACYICLKRNVLCRALYKWLIITISNTCFINVTIPECKINMR